MENDDYAYLSEEYPQNNTYLYLDEQEAEDGGYSYGAPIIMGIICFFGIIFNVIAIMVNCLLKDYKKTSHWYILNLAIVDSAFLIMLPLALTEYLYGDWKFGKGVCVAFNAVFYANYYAGIFFLTVMSFDRYVAILHPMSSAWRKLRSNEGSWAMTVLVWILALVASMPLIISTNLVNEDISKDRRCSISFDYDTKMDKCARAGIPSWRCDEFAHDYSGIFDVLMADSDQVDPNVSSGTIQESDTVTGFPNTYDQEPSLITYETLNTDPFCNHVPYPALVTWIYTNFIVTFAIPVLVMLFCYGCILWRILHPRIPSRQSNCGKGNATSFLKKGKTSFMKKTSQRTNHRVTVLVVALVATFVICWTPFHAHHLAKIKGMNLTTRQCQQLTVVAFLMAYCNSLLNPLLYTFLGANFHKRARKVWDRIKVKNSVTAEFFGSLRRSKSSERHVSRVSTTSRMTKTTETSGTGGQTNIFMQLLSTTNKQEQSSSTAQEL